MGICRLSNRNVTGMWSENAPRRIRRIPVSKLYIQATRLSRFTIALILAVILSIVPLGAAKQPPATLLTGYKAVPVHYGPLNQMLIVVSINGHTANLIVDTGARQSILDSRAAESFGVSPSRYGLRYLGFTPINGQLLPLAFVRTFTAGAMNFGSTLIALFNASGRNSFSAPPGMGSVHVDGILGRDVLTHHKAVINSRTRFIFFKVDASRTLQLANFALTQGFTRVPMRRAESGAFTVPCSINGHSGFLLVDTGAFVTTLHESALKSIGITLQPTQATARFTTGLVRKISLGEVNHLTIGDFKVPPTKLAAAMLPKFALEQGNMRIDGILGLELLVICHAIVDLDSTSLFLK
jgi:predicted aspartyl protease